MSENANDPKNNRAVLTVAQIIKSIMSLAAEAELGALFINLCQAIPAKTTVEEMGNMHSLTLIQTENTTTLEFTSKNLQPKATKSNDVKFMWIRDQSDQKQFRYYCGRR